MAAITGTYLYNKAMELAGMSFTDYISQGPQADVYFQKAMIETVEDLYLQIQDQRIKDELYGFTQSNFLVSVINSTTNSINLGPSVAAIISYQNNFPVAGTVTYTVTTIQPHNIPAVIGNFVYLSGVQGLTYLSTHNNNWQVTVVNANVFTFSVVATETGTYTNNSGMFYWNNTSANSSPLQLINYFHLLNITATYVKTIYPPIGISTLISDATNNSPVRISLFTWNNLRTGDQVTLNGFSLNTNANGTFYINKVNSLQFDLYNDKYFLSPVIGNGAYVPTDPMTIGRTYIKPCKPYMPDERISPLSNPSEDSPRYLESNNQLIFYPQNPAKLISLSFDYVTLPLNIFDTTEPFTTYPYAFINTNDNVLDMSVYYHHRFLERLPEKFIELVSRQSRDNDLMQETQIIDQNNP